MHWQARREERKRQDEADGIFTDDAAGARETLARCAAIASPTMRRNSECELCCAADRCLQLLSALAGLRWPTATVMRSGSCRSAAFRKSASCYGALQHSPQQLTPNRLSGEFSIFQDESTPSGPSVPSSAPRTAVRALAPSFLAMMHRAETAAANSGTRLRPRRTRARRTRSYVCGALRLARSLTRPSLAGACHVELSSPAHYPGPSRCTVAGLCARRVRRRRREPAARHPPSGFAGCAAQA